MLRKRGGNPDEVREEPGQVNQGVQQKAIAREQVGARKCIASYN